MITQNDLGIAIRHMISNQRKAQSCKSAFKKDVSPVATLGLDVAKYHCAQVVEKFEQN